MAQALTVIVTAYVVFFVAVDLLAGRLFRRSPRTQFGPLGSGPVGHPLDVEDLTPQQRSDEVALLNDMVWGDRR